MAQQTGVVVEGLAKTVKNLERLGVEVADLKAAFGAIATKAIDYARPLVPVKTGRLRDNIRAAKTSNKAVIRAGSKAKVPYAGAINYGWHKRNIKPTHFLTKAADDHATEYKTLIDNNIGLLIRKHGLGDRI